MTEQPPTSAASETPSISVEQYWRLPDSLRRDFDAWLEAEGLVGERLTWLRLLEGAIEAERYATDSDGQVIVQGRDELVRERRIYPISTAPPKEALSA